MTKTINKTCNGWGGQQVGEKCDNIHCEYHIERRNDVLKRMQTYFRCKENIDEHTYDIDNFDISDCVNDDNFRDWVEMMYGDNAHELIDIIFGGGINELADTYIDNLNDRRSDEKEDLKSIEKEIKDELKLLHIT